jgi:hypothetical protein
MQSWTGVLLFQMVGRRARGESLPAGQKKTGARTPAIPHPTLRARDLFAGYAKRPASNAGGLVKTKPDVAELRRQERRTSSTGASSASFITLAA